MERKNICYIYTDGSCYANHPNKLGGTGFIMKYYDEWGDVVRELKVRKGYSNTTISRMEMKGIIMALKSLKQPLKIPIVIVTDSKFTYDAIVNNSFSEWLASNSVWGDGKGKKKNRDMWVKFNKIYSTIDKDKVTFVHTKGHGKGEAEHKEGNEEVDKLVSYKNFQNFTPDIQ